MAVVGAVEIEVLLASAGFNQTAARDIQPGLTGIGRSIKTTVDQANADFAGLGDTALQALEPLKDAEALETFGAAIEAAADTMRDELPDATRDSMRDVGRVIDQADILDGLDISDDFRQITSSLETEAARTADAMEEEFSGVGREALAKFNQEVELANRSTREIQAVVDLVGEEAFDELEAAVKRVSSTPIRLDADGRPAASEIQEISQAYESISAATLVLSADNADAKAKIDELIGLTSSVKDFSPIIDIAVRDEAIRQARSDIQRLGNENVDIDVNLDDTGVRNYQPDGIELPLTADPTELASSIRDMVAASGPIGGIVAAGGAALGGLFIASISQAIDAEVVNDRLAAQLGLTSQEAEIAGEVAGRVYAGAWGDSLEQVNEAVRGTIELVGGATEDTAGELERLTGFALDLSATYDQDVNEVIRATSALLSNDLAQSGEEAFDILTVGFQNAGIRGDDLLETFSEYSNQFSDAGFSARDFLTILDVGLDNGARSSDGLADAVKEINLEISGATDSAKFFIEQLGLNFEEIQGLFASGQGLEGLQLVSEALGDVNDKAEQQRIAQELFKGTYEQIGLEAVLAFGEVEASIDDVSGATERLSETLNTNLAVQATAFRREFEVALTDLGTGIVGALQGEDTSQDIADAGERLGQLAGEAFVTAFAAAASTTGEFLSADALFDFDGPLFSFQAGLFDGIREQAGGVLSDLNPFGDADFSDAPIPDFSDFDLSDVRDELASTGFPEFAAQADEAAVSLDDFGDSADDAVVDVELLGESIERFIDGVRSGFDFSADQLFRDVIEQTEGWAEALTGLEDVTINAVGGIDQTSEAGRRLSIELEGANRTLLDQLDVVASGAISAEEFADRQAQLADSFRVAATEAGLTQTEIGLLVSEYLNIPPEVVSQLVAQVDTLGLVEFRAEIDRISRENRIELGFDFAEGSDAEAAVFEAQNLFRDLETTIPILFDLDQDGLVSAQDTVRGFRDLEALAKLGFDFDESGATDAEEAANAFEVLEFFAGLGFDVDLSGKVTAEEQARTYELLEYFAELGYDLNRDGLIDATDEALAYQLEVWRTELGYDVNDSERLAALNDVADWENGIATTSLDADATAFRAELDAAHSDGVLFGEGFYEPTLGANNEPFNSVIDESLRSSGSFDEVMVDATLGADADPFNQTLQDANGDGLFFDDTTFESDLAGNPSDWDAALAAATGGGNGWDAAAFEAAIRGDESDALSAIGSAEGAASRWEGRAISAIVRAVDQASGTIDRIARTRTVTLNVRQGTSRLVGFDGGIIDRESIKYMASGGVLDGIQEATPGGVAGIFGQQPFVIAENGGDELFLNSLSTFGRQLDLIEEFDGGALASDLQRHFANSARSFNDGGILTGPPATPIAAVQRAPQSSSEQMRDLTEAVRAGVAEAMRDTGDRATVGNIEQLNVLAPDPDEWVELALVDQR